MKYILTAIAALAFVACTTDNIAPIQAKGAHPCQDALVAALDGAGFAVQPPEQGLHLLLPLPDGCDDRAMAQAARRQGFGVRALSPMYLAAPQRGLVIGFSGFAPEVLAQAARRGSAVWGVAPYSST